MKLLKRNTKKIKSDKIGVAMRIYKYLQLRWVRIMERFALRFSRRGLTVCLISFILSGVTFNTLIITGYVKSSNVKVEAIEAPKYVEQPAELIEREIKNSQEREIKAFQEYLRTLPMTPEGKQLYDSLVTENQKLLDSVAEINSNP